MYKKKEIIAIISILIASISLSFLPNLISFVSSNEENIENLEVIDTKVNTIKVCITGEIKESSIEIEVPYGASYGYIISKIEVYLNSYSIIEKDFKKRYYEDTNIVIESLDIKEDIEDIEVKDESKIKISTASKLELMSLYGIGEKRAESIIKYREEKKIESWSELRSLLGVSNEIIEAIKEKAVL